MRGVGWRKRERMMDNKSMEIDGIYFLCIAKEIGMLDYWMTKAEKRRWDR